ncbi:MAG TPA: hypothetical protein DEB24_00270 [Coriobacteriia bacterium]|nr:hypothetical protein [Coriobacteriia bacterium]
MAGDVFNARAEISKKALLRETGISYGQLYRWKREGLIPEEWFIKRSASTGQETFFRRERIIGRIEAIKSMKDDKTLSEIREFFENDRSGADLRSALIEGGETDPEFIDTMTDIIHRMQPSKKAMLAVTALIAALAEARTEETEKRKLLMRVVEVLSGDSR